MPLKAAARLAILIYEWPWTTFILYNFAQGFMIREICKIG